MAGSAEERQFRSSLSAVLGLGGGRALVLGSDETVRAEPTVESLLRRPDGSYGSHRSFPIGDFLSLPDETRDEGRVGEVDIEGLAEADGYLWLTGSHCANRKRPKASKAEGAQIEQLAKVERGKNRFVLGRIPLGWDDSGVRLEIESAGRHAQRFRHRWLEALSDDPHLGSFVKGLVSDESPLPSKDNGFDAEGLAVRTRSDGSTQLLLGLRGPVLRGFAVILELSPTPDDEGKLELRPLPGGNARYRKHFLDLRGLGVRDLGFVGDDLWILAGPTMALDGPVALFRWRAPLERLASGDTLTRSDGERLTRELLLPFGEGDDHAEGFALLAGASPAASELLVVYDSPSEKRLVGAADVLADVFPLAP